MSNFKPGDKVKWRSYTAEVVATVRENENLVIQYQTPKFIMGYAGPQTHTELVQPHTLTLIPNENHTTT